MSRSQSVMLTGVSDINKISGPWSKPLQYRQYQKAYTTFQACIFGRRQAAQDIDHAIMKLTLQASVSLVLLIRASNMLRNAE